MLVLNREQWPKTLSRRSFVIARDCQTVRGLEGRNNGCATKKAEIKGRGQVHQQKQSCRINSAHTSLFSPRGNGATNEVDDDSLACGQKCGNRQPVNTLNDDGDV